MQPTNDSIIDIYVSDNGSGNKSSLRDDMIVQAKRFVLKVLKVKKGERPVNIIVRLN